MPFSHYGVPKVRQWQHDAYKNPVCSKADFCSANLTSEVLFSLKFLELVCSTEARNLLSSNKTEEFVLKNVGAYPFRRLFLTLLTLSGVLC